LRFLNSCIPSIVVTYWNPASISCAASFAVVAPEHVHSSSVRFRRLDLIEVQECPFDGLIVRAYRLERASEPKTHEPKMVQIEKSTALNNFTPFFVAS